MQTLPLQRTHLATAVALALGVTNTPAQAQQSSENTVLEEVVVTGIRQSLEKSADFKREDKGVVDAITAEDIGAFPDTNLAEALQRVTGVSIDRARGEGQYVTVRGFGPAFNLVTLNGRQMPTTGGSDIVSRSFDFSNLAVEGVSRIEVFKSGKADVPTGGIGSTINIVSTRPLEAPGFKGTVSASGMYDQSTEEGDSVTPEVSFLFSNTFFDDTVGIAISGVRQERNNGQAQASVDGWRSFQGDVDNSWSGERPSEWGGIPYDQATQQNRTTLPEERYSVPQNTGYEFAEWDRTRTNGQLTLQWAPTDSIEATLDYTFADQELQRTFTNYSAWYNFGGQTSSWDGNNSNASPLFYSENNGGAGDFGMGGGSDATIAETDSLGFNLSWDATQQLTLMFDYHDSSAEQRPDSDLGSSSVLSTAAFTRSQTTTFFDRGDLPVLALELSDPLSPDDMIVTGSVFTNQISEMDIEQARFEGNYAFDVGFVESVDFGVAMTEVNNRSAQSVVQRDAWGGVTQPGAIADLMEEASSNGRFDEVSGGNDPDLVTEYYSFNVRDVIARTEELIAAGEASLFMIPDMGPCGTGFCASPNYTVDRRTTEEQLAAYAQINLAFDIGDMPLDVRLGARYEETDVDSSALAPSYSGINWVGGNEFSAVPSSDTFTQLKGSYDNFLPNVDLRLGVTEDIVLRASYSTTMSRPNYSDIQGGQTIDQLVRINGGTGNQGNPGLLPLESDNIDLSFEWYYGEASYLSIGYFTKDVTNFIVFSEVNESLFDLAHPGNGAYADEARAVLGDNATSGELYNWILENKAGSPGVDVANGIISGQPGDDLANFALTTPVNGDSATVDGWEVNLQHTFGETGLGFIVNATIVESDTSYDNTDLSAQFALAGISDSANFIAFYENDWVAARVAYNWRDSFLAGTGQANVGAIPPTYVDTYGQWDASLQFTVMESLNLFIDAINITDETRYVYGRSAGQPLFVQQSGPRFNIGARYTF
ncbi:TonB-dependent receptor [Congregibacter sp.]|uniref:TonB-dependent receptor n=1 Tax=Congregibacter sp. TaxID=2744308 RepID=UPI003F6CC0EC